MAGAVSVSAVLIASVSHAKGCPDGRNSVASPEKTVKQLSLSPECTCSETLDGSLAFPCHLGPG